MGLDEGHEFPVSLFKKLLSQPKLMIGRMKASRTAGKAEPPGGGRNAESRPSRIYRSLDFVGSFCATADRESLAFPSPRARMKRKKARIVGVRSGLNVEPRIRGDAALEVEWTLESLIKR
jgi:hypothetical protein